MGLWTASSTWNKNYKYKCNFKLHYVWNCKHSHWPGLFGCQSTSRECIWFGLIKISIIEGKDVERSAMWHVGVEDVGVRDKKMKDSIELVSNTCRPATWIILLCISKEHKDQGADITEAKILVSRWKKIVMVSLKWLVRFTKQT